MFPAPPNADARDGCGARLPARTRLLVVGAGPHALALCARLREPLVDRWAEWPGNRAMFREAKDGRYYHVKKNEERERQRAKHEIIKAMYATPHAPLDPEDLIVVDPRGAWMSRWQSAFDLLGIEHLRSTRFTHLDPTDMDALSVASERFDGPPVVAVSERSGSGRLDHWVQLKGLNKRPDFHGPFDAPSTALFNAHCEQISRRYRLGDSLARGTVTALRPGAGEGGRWIEVDVALPVANESGTERDAVAAADEGGRGAEAPQRSPRIQTVQAERVVFAGGFAAAPRWPEWALEAKAQAEAAGAPPGAIAHAHDLFEAGRAASVASHAGETVCVIGGALTACHLALAARSRLGYARATLVARREIEIRQFDLDDPWMSIGRNVRLAAYWSEPDAEARLAAARAARRCATASPELVARVRAEAKAGRLDAREDVEVWAATWEPAPAQRSGKDLASDRRGGRAGAWRLELSDGTTLVCNRVWLATGSDADVRADPVLGPLAAPDSPLPPRGGTPGGLPGLTPELRWAEGAQLYVMGAYATLQLGPDALNLAGARAGAARVAAALGWAPRSCCDRGGGGAAAGRAGDEPAAPPTPRQRRFAPRVRARGLARE